MSNLKIASVYVVTAK